MSSYFRVIIFYSVIKQRQTWTTLVDADSGLRPDQAQQMCEARWAQSGTELGVINTSIWCHWQQIRLVSGQRITCPTTNCLDRFFGKLSARGNPQNFAAARI